MRTAAPTDVANQSSLGDGGFSRAGEAGDATELEALGLLLDEVSGFDVIAMGAAGETVGVDGATIGDDARPLVTK